jgi:anti-sigma-K factor RskA
MKYTDPVLRDKLAGEYVLGTLHGRARQRFERLLLEDAGLQTVVTDWESRLNPLAEMLSPVEPPARVWKQIQLRTGMPREAKPSFWNRLDFWRPLALTASALAAALILYIGAATLMPQAPVVNYVAVLSDKEAKAAWVASSIDKSSFVIRPLASQTVPAGKTLELWVIPGKDQSPRSLGLLPEAGSKTVSLSEPLRRAATPGAALAISLEPAGGSPTGLPTGPVLYQGAWMPVGPARSPA